MPRPAAVSVVIPTHDRWRLLRRALTSVREQTRPADEVIVVDDGSTDQTADRIAGEFPEVTLLRQENRGVSAARNRGVAEASGAWVAFLDSDDEWLPIKLERQLTALEGAPGHPLCHTDEVWIRNGRRVDRGRRYAKTGGWIFHACLPLCAISPSSAVIRRGLLDEIGGFDESLPACEDYDLWLRICSRWPVLLVNEPLVVRHGGHDDQLSRRVPALDRYRIRALEKILGSGILGSEDRSAALDMLLLKMDIYIEGARRRGRTAEVADLIRSKDRWRATGEVS
jgi:glycosyltransferase involved in cell wall biosynthesis